MSSGPEVSAQASITIIASSEEMLDYIPVAVVVARPDSPCNERYHPYLGNPAVFVVRHTTDLQDEEWHVRHVDNAK